MYYDLLAISWDLFGELGIFMNFNDHTVTWDTNILSLLKCLIYVFMTAIKPKTLINVYSWATKILSAEYKPESSDDVIKTFENLHVGDQHHF
jgi:hypothetical protein